MSAIKVIAILAAVSLALTVVSKAQLNRKREGLVLLRSTCVDVKRALNVDKCAYPRSTYYLKGKTISVSFGRGSCAPVSNSKTPKDKVEINDVVTDIFVQLHEPVPISTFIKDKGKWESFSTDFIDEVKYSNADEGISISSVGEKVHTVTYYPSMN